MSYIDRHWGRSLLSRYGGILGTGDYECGQQALQRAVAIARREGDVRLEAQTLTYAAEVSGRHLDWQKCVDLGEMAIELAACLERLRAAAFEGERELDSLFESAKEAWTRLTADWNREVVGPTLDALMAIRGLCQAL